MKQSPELAELAAALCEAQGSFPTIPKERDAKIVTRSGGEYSYKYADLTDVIEAVRPFLKANGLSVVQAIGMKKGRDVITTRLLHKSGQWLQDTIRVPGIVTTEAQSATPQALGSGITYGKRYAYGAMLGITTDTDDDGSLAEIAFGEGAARKRSKTAKPPSGSTSTQGTRGGRKPIPQDPATAGKTQLPLSERNKITKFLANLNPPVNGDAVAKHVGAVLGADGPVAMAKLTVEQGADLKAKLGMPTEDAPPPAEAPSDG